MTSNGEGSLRRYITVAAVGDIMLGDHPIRIGNGVRSKIKSRGSEYLFQNVRILFQNSDLVFGNLEAVLSNRGLNLWSLQASQLRGEPESIKGLKFAGFNVLNLSNNHALDHGRQALEETCELLSANQIAYVGKEPDLAPTLISANGLLVALLGSNSVAAQAQDVGVDWEERLLGVVSEAAKRADILIVSLHWGAEYVPYPSPSQIKLARQVIDQGATLVLGHHPHVVQGVERYHGGLICYSLGNFVFDSWQNRCREGLVVKCTVSAGQVQDLEIIPVLADEQHAVQVLTGSQKEAFWSRFQKQCDEISNDDLSDLDRRSSEYAQVAAMFRAEYRKEVRAYFKENILNYPPHMLVQLAASGALRAIRSFSGRKALPAVTEKAEVRRSHARAR